MERSDIDSILSKMQKPASQMAKVDAVRASVPKLKRKQPGINLDDDDDDDDGDEYIPIGLNGLLSASEKLLAVNRGLDNPDERDSLIFKRFMTTDRLLAERIHMDSDRVRGKMLPALAKQRSLKSLHPFMFDHYMEGFLLGNPLSTPLEEINPLHLVEQSRRVTQMGPGGIGSDNAVTENMQAIHPSQFGFISVLEGPECFSKNTDVYTQNGWVSWSDVKDDAEFACVINNEMQFRKAERIVREHYKGGIFSITQRHFKTTITPGHRLLYATTHGKMCFSKYRIKLASELFGKKIMMPAWSHPHLCAADNSIQDREIHVLPRHWAKVEYDDMVYCATVPGGMLLCREDGQTPFWTGNSEKAGIDTRMAWGTRVGSNGKIYQKFKDRTTGRMKWLSPSDLDGKVLGLPE